MDRINQGKKGFQPDSDVHVTLEDQEKINSFAKCNAKYQDLQVELTAKQDMLKSIDDANEELSLADTNDEEKVPFLYGEVFICLSLTNTLKTLEEEKEKVIKEIYELEKEGEELKSVMSILRTQLYAKFGNHINLGH